jgi:hypothetical protein
MVDLFFILSPNYYNALSTLDYSSSSSVFILAAGKAARIFT